jgi:type I restriction enzyme S subunit
MRNISQSALLDVTVPVVMSEQQDRVIALADAVDSGVVNTRSALSSVQARSSRLRRALLEAAFTGRLTGQATQGETVQELADV